MTIIGEAFIAVKALMDDFGPEVSKSTEAAAKAADDRVKKILTGAGVAVAAIATDASVQWKAGTGEIIERTGATGEALDDLVDSMRDVGRAGDVESSLETIGAVTALLAQRLELTDEPLERLTKQIVQLSEVTGGDAAANTTQIIDLFQRWNVPTERQGELLDYLFAASQKAGVGIEVLIGGSHAAKRVADALGLSLEDMIAVLANIEAGGGNAGKTLAALSMGFSRLAGNTKNPEAALERVAERIRNAESDTKALQIAVEVFGTRSGPLLAGFFRGSASDIEGFNASLGETSGRIDDVRERTITFFDRLGILRRQVGSFIGPVADELAVVATIVTGFGPAAAGIGAVATKFRSVRSEVQALQGWLQAGGETMGTTAAAANVLGAKTGGIALGAGAAILGLGALVTFLNARHHAAVQEARQDMDDLASSLQTAAASGPAAVQRIAQDQLDRTLEAIEAVRGDVNEDIAAQFEGDEAGLAAFRKEAALSTPEIERMAEQVAALRQEARALGGDQRVQASAQADVIAATRQAAISSALYGKSSEQARIQDERRVAAIDALIDAYGGGKGAEEALAGATGEGAEAADDAAQSERELARARRERADETRNARDAELEAAGGILGVIGAIYQQRDARQELAAAEEEVNRLRAEGKQGTDEFSAAERDLRDARLDALEAARGTKESAVGLSDSVRDSVANYDEARKRIARWAGQMNLSRREVDELARRAVGLARNVDEVPEEKDIRFQAPGLFERKNEVEELDAALDRLPRTKTISFQQVGLSTILSAVDAVEDAFARVGSASPTYGPPSPSSSGGGGGGGGGRRPPAQAQRSVFRIDLDGRTMSREITARQGENRILLGGLQDA